MTEKRNRPELRFSEFNDEWNKIKIGDIGYFKNGLNKSNEHFGHGYPFVNLMDVLGENIIKTPSSSFGLVNADSKERLLYNLKKSDVLFIRSSVKKEAVGQTIVVLEDLQNTTYSVFLTRFREKNNVLNMLFKKYCFNTRYFRKKLLSRSTTNANTNINQECLSALPLTLPTQPEQQKIAQFLTTIDTKIEQLTQKKSLLEQYKTSVSQKLFDNSPSHCHSVIRFQNKIDDRNYPNWVEKKLADVADIVSGGTPKTSKKEYWSGDIPWFTPTELKSKYIKKSQRSITALGLAQSSAKILPKGTILLSTRATIGEMSIALKKCSTNQGFQSIVVHHDYNNEFIYYLILMNKKILMRRASGSTFLEINKKEISNIKFLFPSLPEQQKIAQFLSSIDDKISQTTQQLNQTKQFKKALLQQMFI